jgi:MFS transporter, ENTS family, enterobactin (siderophore) exporter
MAEPNGNAPDAAPLSANRDFRLLLASQAISVVGDVVSFTALPLLVLELTGSGVAMGAVLAIQALTDFAFATIAGAYADRGDRKRMMVIADVGRAVLTALIPISVLLGGPTMAVVVVVAAPLSLFRGLFRAGYISSLPAIVGRPHIARANGILETIFSTSAILGPVVAGFLAAAIGPGLTLGLDALSFAASAIGLVLIRRDLHAPTDRPSTRIVDDIREGVAYVVREPVLRSAILLFSLYSALVAPLVVALAVRVTRDLAQSEGVYGIVISAFGVGAVVGSLIAARAGQRINVARALIGGVGVAGLAVLGLSLFAAVPVLFALTVVGGLAETLVAVTYVSVRAAYSPDALLGRIGSTARMVSLGLQPIGVIIGGVLIDTIGGTETIAVLGAGSLILALAFVPVRPLRTARMGEVAPAAPPAAPGPTAEPLDPA